MKLTHIVQLGALSLLLTRLRHGANLVKVSTAPTSERVTVLIPARNEAHNIARCLDALEEVHELIVIDDGSTDGTADIAAAHGAKVVESSELPKDWIGKPWALQQGLAYATGDLVVCLDADTIPQPGLIGAITAQLRNADLASFATRFRCNSATETALHASMLATLVYRFGPPGTPLPAHRKIGNGQCMAFRTEWLQANSGFQASSTHMTDDIAMVRKLALAGARVKFVDGGEFIEVDMHRTTAEVWREWGRSLPMSDVTDSVGKWVDIAFLWVTLALPLPRVITHRGNAFDYTFLAIRIALNGPFSKAYRNRRPWVWASPLSDVAAVARLTQATAKPERSWKGRVYPQ